MSFNSNLSRLEVGIKALGLLALLCGIFIATASLIILYDDLPWSKPLLTYGITIGGIFAFLGYRGLKFRERDSPGIIYEHDS